MPPIKLYPFGDIHVGYKDRFMKDFFEKTLYSIYKEPNSYILGMGDYIECSTSSSVEPYSSNGENSEHYLQIKNYFKPFAKDGRLIGLLSGNHEDRLYKDSNFNLVRILAEDLEVPFYARGALFDFKGYDIYACHPDTAPTTRGGRDLLFRKAFAVFDADLYLFAHLHTLDSDDNGIRFNRIGQTRKYFACTGHFLKYLATYAERKVYSAQLAGVQEILFYQNVYKIKIQRYEKVD